MTKTMTAKNPLSEREVKLLENAISSGFLDKVRPYVEDALFHYSENKTELHRRRMLVMLHTNNPNNPNNPNTMNVNVEHVYTVTLLGVFMDDIDGWKASIKLLGNDVDPGFGLLAYRFLHHYHKDPSMLEKWSFLLEFSKRKGHIEATLIWWNKKLSKFGFAGKLLGYILRLFFGIKSGVIAFNNPQDPRLSPIKNNDP